MLDHEICISFIIPAFNEEEYIGGTIRSINCHAKDYSFKIFVIDNGSTDQTRSIANSLENVTVILSPDVTISNLRNIGASQSECEILVFLDADVQLTAEWSKHISLVIDELRENPMMVTGSRCIPPDSDNWLIKYWFIRLTQYQAPYVNSGHLITSRTLFETISGFTENLETAEDYDFCMKAKSRGGRVLNRRDIPVIHFGYPLSVRDFINRERWHGKQDFSNLETFLKSKIAIVAMFHSLSLILLAAYSLLSGKVEPLLGYVAISGAIAIALTLKKFGIRPLSHFPVTVLIFYFYIVGRSLSLGDRIISLVKTSSVGTKT